MKNLADHKSKLRLYVVPVSGLGFEYFDKSGIPVSEISNFFLIVNINLLFG
jgi:hypothetical protein